jgi:DNA-binding MarR family transcriptional regulator
MNKSSVYLRFLNLAHTIQGDFAESAIDLTALRLLEAIAVAHAQSSPLTVTDAMALSAIASPATLHRKLDALREAGFIEQEYEGKNRRTKYLVTTENTAKYFEQMGKALVLAAKPA